MNNRLLPAIRHWAGAIALIFASICYQSPANADGVDDLKQFYQTTQSMRADFKQTVFDQKGRKVQEVNGNIDRKSVV